MHGGLREHITAPDRGGGRIQRFRSGPDRLIVGDLRSPLGWAVRKEHANGERTRVDEIEQVFLGSRLLKHPVDANFGGAAIMTGKDESGRRRIGMLTPAARIRSASSRPVISGM